MNLSLSLREIFPITFSLLSEEQERELTVEFEAEWGLGKLHFFPMLIRQKQFSETLQEVADYEFLRHLVASEAPFSLRPRAHFFLHPSVQYLLIRSAADTLMKDPGVYLLWKSEGCINERRVSEAEALLLDRLKDDQLVYPQDLSSEEQPIAEELKELGIVMGPSEDCS